MSSAKQKLYPVRIRCEGTENVEHHFLSKEQLIHGLEGYEMNLEDIGAALLTELREQHGAEASKPTEAGLSKELHEFLRSQERLLVEMEVDEMRGKRGALH